MNLKEMIKSEMHSHLDAAIVNYDSNNITRHDFENECANALYVIFTVCNNEWMTPEYCEEKARYYDRKRREARIEGALWIHYIAYSTAYYEAANIMRRIALEEKK